MTNDILCGYPGDREAMLMSYLYDDIPPAERQAFEQHLATCARCRTELNGLDDVRGKLAQWSPPEPNFNLTRRQATIVVPESITGSGPGVPGFLGVIGSAGSTSTEEIRRGWWREMPAWAQVAAALLVLGVSAGIANLDVRYDNNGLSVRTGWSKTPAGLVAVDSAGKATPVAPAEWRSELAALERQLRNEFRATQVSTSAGGTQTVRSSPPDADVMRRVKSLVDESERRQQNELALRMGEVIRDLNLQRQADLRKIDQNLGMFQDRTGVEVLRNRQKLDYILQRVSQQPQ
jgi:anti-sigma factor RsiW